MTVVSPDLADWAERQYVSQYGQPPLILAIHIGGVPADPDGQAVTAQLLLQNADGSTTSVSTYSALRTGTGVYQVTPSSNDTATPGDALLGWSYSVSSQPQQYASMLEIGRANPAYDSLPVSMQAFVEDQLWSRFKDLFDSPDGGANLTTYFESHWSRGRVAQLMKITIGKINSSAQPFSVYTVDGNGGPQFPIQLWGGLLSSYTYCEMVKHLIRSYVEQPLLQGGAGVTRLDRRDYTDRWREVLRDEQAELKSLLDVFKIRHMGLGNPRVLVSGGTYGRYAPTRIAGSVAARPRMWARWRSGTNLTGTVLCLYATSQSLVSVSRRPAPVLQQCGPGNRSERLSSLARSTRSQYGLRPAQLDGHWRQAARSCCRLVPGERPGSPSQSGDRPQARHRSHVSQRERQLSGR